MQNKTSKCANEPLRKMEALMNKERINKLSIKIPIFIIQNLLENIIIIISICWSF